MDGSPRWRYLGSVEVDSGCLLIGDPGYLLPRLATGRAGLDYQAVVDADWREPATAVADGLALLLQRFGGDGSFPVVGLFEGEELLSVRIDFGPPEAGDADSAP